MTFFMGKNGTVFLLFRFRDTVHFRLLFQEAVSLGRCSRVVSQEVHERVKVRSLCSGQTWGVHFLQWLSTACESVYRLSRKGSSLWTQAGSSSEPSAISGPEPREVSPWRGHAGSRRLLPLEHRPAPKAGTSPILRVG